MSVLPGLSKCDVRLQSWKKLMGKVKKLSKNGNDKKSLILVSLQCLAAMAKVLFSEERLHTRFCLQPTLRLL